MISVWKEKKRFWFILFIRSYKKGVVGTLQVSPKGDAQSAETFRVVGMGAMDG